MRAQVSVGKRYVDLFNNPRAKCCNSVKCISPPPPPAYNYQYLQHMIQ
jgi:hypothetical protein